MKRIAVVLAAAVAMRVAAVVVTAGLEFPSDADLSGDIVMQFQDNYSQVVGTWTVPSSGMEVTNEIAAAADVTNAMIAVSSLPTDDARLVVDGVAIAHCRGGVVTVRPAMRIGTVDGGTGLANIDLRKLRRALGAWRPRQYGAFTNEYAGFTGTVVGVSAPRARSAGRGFVSVNVPASRDELDGKIMGVFLDADGNGRYTAGELYGCQMVLSEAEDWFGLRVVTNDAWMTSRRFLTNDYLRAEMPVALTRTSSRMARFDLSPLLSGSAAVVTDRDVAGGIYQNVDIGNTVTNIPSASAVRVRMVLTAVNGQKVNGAQVFNEACFDWTLDLNRKTCLTEADMMASSRSGVEFDIINDVPFWTFGGWREYGNSNRDLYWDGIWPVWRDVIGNGSASLADIRSATFRVVIGNGSISNTGGEEHLASAFVNLYENEANQSACGLVWPTGTVTDAKMVFKWRNGNIVGKDYPDCRIRVWKSDGTTLVWDSGIVRTPARGVDGVYTWESPLYVDFLTSRNVKFEDDANYEWGVSMLDAKFTTYNSSQPRASFRIEAR